MADATELIDQHSERAKVESWRLHVLIEAGYPLPLAEKLAAALDADLHEAVELVCQGCDPRTAAEILLICVRTPAKPVSAPRPLKGPQAALSF